MAKKNIITLGQNYIVNTLWNFQNDKIWGLEKSQENYKAFKIIIQKKVFISQIEKIVNFSKNLDRKV